MEKMNTKIGDNGSSQASKLGSKNRLRIHGTAILERENHPNITASYDYSTAYANGFFQEDVNQLRCFELNKIALGMTIFKKEDSYCPSDLRVTANGHNYKNGTNGLKNGSSLALQKYDSEALVEPHLTDVIWSRMDMTNPSHNPNAYIIKQYYNASIDRQHISHGDRCNNFLCGFISCCIMMAIGCAVAWYSKDLYPML